jgi:tetratricopeptide (TPR) repeat protein
LQLGLLHQFLNSTCSFSWITAFDRYFSLKRGESHGTILSAQQIILANLQRKLETAEGADAVVSKRCIDKCRTLLLESTQDSLRIERFHSGPAAQATLEKTLRLVECYCASSEIEVAQEVALEAFETAKTSLGPLHPLSLQIERVKLYTQAKCLEKSSSVASLDMITDFIRLVQQHVEVYGTDHMETIGCRHDLALIHLSRFEYIEARKILEPLHKRTTEKLGRTSSRTHPIANSLAACANMQGDYDYAESILYTIPGLPEAAAEPLEIDITTMPRQILHALSILAAVLGAKDEDRKSEVLHQRVIDGFTAQAGPKAWRIYESAINKGQALRDQFKYDEARKHYLEWIKKADQYFGADSQYSRKMRKRLVDIEVRERKWNEMSEGLRSPSAQNPSDLRKLQDYRMWAMILLLALVSSIWIRSLR